MVWGPGWGWLDGGGFDPFWSRLREEQYATDLGIVYDYLLAIPTVEPTVAPTVAPTPEPGGVRQVAPASGWATLVCSYDWPCQWALAVVACESEDNPGAYNPDGPYLGLFQVWEGYSLNLYDPETNVAVAYGLYSSGGSGHWPYCP